MTTPTSALLLALVLAVIVSPVVVSAVDLALRLRMANRGERQYRNLCHCCCHGSQCSEAAKPLVDTEHRCDKSARGAQDGQGNDPLPDAVRLHEDSALDDDGHQEQGNYLRQNRALIGAQAHRALHSSVAPTNLSSSAASPAAVNGETPEGSGAAGAPHPAAPRSGSAS